MHTVFFALALTVVSISSILAQTAATASKRSGAQDFSFSMPARQGWVDTNIDLDPGDRVHITGSVIDCAGPTPTEKLNVPLPGAPVGALLAKLHAESTPVTVMPDAEFAVTAPSHLYLGVNGWRCPGTIPAKVHVERHSAKTRKP